VGFQMEWGGGDRVVWCGGGGGAEADGDAWSPVGRHMGSRGSAAGVSEDARLMMASPELRASGAGPGAGKGQQHRHGGRIRRRSVRVRPVVVSPNGIGTASFITLLHKNKASLP
jgi:hypothetical protein